MRNSCSKRWPKVHCVTTRKVQSLLIQLLIGSVWHTECNFLLLTSYQALFAWQEQHLQRHSHDTVRTRFNRDLRAVRNCDVTIRGSEFQTAFEIWANRVHFEHLWLCSEDSFIFMTVEPSCRLVVCERTNDYSHRFVTVTARQLQPLSNCRVNDVYITEFKYGFIYSFCERKFVKSPLCTVFDI